MPRGGKRAGAGRKPGCTFLRLDRVRFYDHCERLWREACKENEERAISERLRKVRKEWAKAQAVPVSDRKSWLGSEDHKVYLEDVEFALREDQGINADDSTEPDRVVRIHPKRPKGPRNSIIKQVSKEETRRLGRRVSERMVKEFWKEFRRFEKDIDHL